MSQRPLCLCWCLFHREELGPRFSKSVALWDQLGRCKNNQRLANLPEFNSPLASHHKIWMTLQRDKEWLYSGEDWKTPPSIKTSKRMPSATGWIKIVSHPTGRKENRASSPPRSCQAWINWTCSGEAGWTQGEGCSPAWSWHVSRSWKSRKDWGTFQTGGDWRPLANNHTLWFLKCTFLLLKMLPGQ